MNLTERKCPICHSSSEHKYQYKFDNIEYNIDVCVNCGFVFQNPIYEKEHYHSLNCSYPDDYFYHAMRRGSYIYKFIKEFIKRDPKVDVLDIGAGRCEVLKYILNQGFSGHHAYKDSNSYKGVAITLEDKEKIYMSDKWNIDVQHFDFEDKEKVNSFISDNENKFDFIIMSHVLEHFINPNNVLKNVRKLLSPNGLLYIEVPSFYNAEYRIKSVWRPEHKSYFTKQTLATLFANNRIWIEKIKDSKIWGNIKVVCKFAGFDEDIDYWIKSDVDNVIKEYNSNKLKKFIQRLKHKLHFEYGDNE